MNRHISTLLCLLISVLMIGCQQINQETDLDATPLPTATLQLPVTTVATPTIKRHIEKIQDRGYLLCGGRTDAFGFGYLDENKEPIGFDIDLCRAVAAAVFGDSQKMQLVPITTDNRRYALNNYEIDMLSRNTTWKTTRDIYWGDFTTVMFYDGQTFMAPNDKNITTMDDLRNKKICVFEGGSSQTNLIDGMSRAKISFQIVLLDTRDIKQGYLDYENGACDAMTGDASLLSSGRVGFLKHPENHLILSEKISKEPLAPIVPHGDYAWSDVVNIVMMSLITAEELGVNSQNIDQMLLSDDIEIQRLLGQESTFGQSALGLKQDFVVDVIRQVGNYEEIYNRYFGPNGIAFYLPRGQNELWSNGGLLYAPPMK